MHGNSTGFSVQDALLIIGIQSRTGELILESGNNIGTVLSYKSKILHAFSPYSRAFGDLLVEAGILTETDLIETLMLQKKNPNTPLGSFLIKSGKVTYEVVEMMVHEQIRCAIKEFQSWRDISFSFVDKDLNPFDNIHLPIHSFITPEALQSAAGYLSIQAQAKAQPLQQTDSPSIL
jgi:hypothetical protein